MIGENPLVINALTRSSLYHGADVTAGVATDDSFDYILPVPDLVYVIQSMYGVSAAQLKTGVSKLDNRKIESMLFIEFGYLLAVEKFNSLGVVPGPGGEILYKGKTDKEVKENGKDKG